MKRDIKRENAEIARTIENLGTCTSNDTSNICYFLKYGNNLSIRGMWQFDNIFQAQWWYNYTDKQWRAFMGKLQKRLDALYCTPIPGTEGYSFK